MYISEQSAASVCNTLHEMCCMQLEFKLKDALRENATASREVKSMRASLKSLQLSKLRQPSRGRRQQDEPVGDTPGIAQLGEKNHSTCMAVQLLAVMPALTLQTCLRKHRQCQNFLISLVCLPSFKAACNMQKEMGAACMA